MNTESWQTKALNLVNRLRTATQNRKVAWERTVSGDLMTSLETGGQAYIRRAQQGGAVSLQVLEADGDTAFEIDSAVLPDDLLKLALLQLYVSARNGAVSELVDRAQDVLGDL